MVRLRSRAQPRPPLTAHLLPNFDEFTVAYRDRSAVINPELPFDPTFFAYYRESSPGGGVLSNVVTVGGMVSGSWRRTLTPKVVRVDLRLLSPLSSAEKAAVEKAAKRLGLFLQRTADLRLG